MCVAIGVGGPSFVPARCIADAIDPDVHVDLTLGLQQPNARRGRDLERIFGALVVCVDLTDADVSHVEIDDSCWCFVLCAREIERSRSTETEEWMN